MDEMEEESALRSDQENAQKWRFDAQGKPRTKEPGEYLAMRFFLIKDAKEAGEDTNCPAEGCHKQRWIRDDYDAQGWVLDEHCRVHSTHQDRRPGGSSGPLTPPEPLRPGDRPIVAFIRQYLERAGGPVRKDELRLAVQNRFGGGGKARLKRCATQAGAIGSPDGEKKTWWLADSYLKREARLIREVLHRDAINRRLVIDETLMTYHRPDRFTPPPDTHVWCPGCRVRFATREWADHEPAMMREIGGHSGQKNHREQGGLTIDDLPEGIYPDNIYRLDDALYAVDLPHGVNCACGRVRVTRLDFKMLNTGVWRLIETTDNTVLPRLDPATRLTLEEIQQVGRRQAHCVAFRTFGRRCNARLTAPESIERGMGPTCFARYLKDHDPKEEDDDGEGSAHQELPVPHELRGGRREADREVRRPAGVGR